MEEEGGTIPMHYMGWYEGDAKKSLDRVLEEATEYFKAKFGRDPVEILVPIEDEAKVGREWRGIPVEGRSHVPAHNYWIGEAISGF